MAHLTGIFLVDAPASALNNAGADPERPQTDNAVAVKLIRAPEGRYPYVSAQAVRYWLRTQLGAGKLPDWTSSPVHREEKIAYTAADPIKYAEDDIFGYMRAPSGMDEDRKAIAAGLTELETEKRNGKQQPVPLTRISPLRVGTLVSLLPVKVTGDFGTMARADDYPVLHRHQFYRAHLKAPLALDLTCAGTFFVSPRVGYKNVDKKRVESAKGAKALEVEVRGLRAWRLPSEQRRTRVAQVVRVLGRLEGGAKQTLHLTDTAPAILVLAVCRSGNQPFQRLFTADELKERTVLRLDVLAEALRVFKEDLLSDVYIGWAKGFLDRERQKLEQCLQEAPSDSNKALPEALAVATALRDLSGRKIRLGHPREMADAVAKDLENKTNAWFD